MGRGEERGEGIARRRRRGVRVRMRRIGFFRGEVIVAAVVVVVVVMVELINKGGYTSISPPHFFAQNTSVFVVGCFSVSIFEFRDV